MLTITRVQMDTLAKARLGSFIKETVQLLHHTAPGYIQGLDQEQAFEKVRTAVEWAQRKGFATARQIRRCIAIATILDGDQLDRGAHAAVRAHLEGSEHDPEVRLAVAEAFLRSYPE